MDKPNQPDLNTHTHVIAIIDKYDDIEVYGPYTRTGAETLAALAGQLASSKDMTIRVIALSDFKLL